VRPLLCWGLRFIDIDHVIDLGYFKRLTLIKSERFNMQNCKRGNVPVVKGDKFDKDQCPKIEIEQVKINDIPFESSLGSLMYA